MNNADHVATVARSAPAQIAILHESGALSYGELDFRVNQAANLLESYGASHGARVALLLPNIAEFAIVYLAVQKVGAVAVSIGAMLKTNEIRHILEDSAATLLFTTADLVPEVVPLVGRLPTLQQIVLCEGQSDDLPTLDSEASRQSGVYAPRDLAPNDPAAILYTSGTTGRQKGAILTHGNLISNATAAARSVGSRPGDRHLLFLPLFHCFGQSFIMNASFRSAGTIVLARTL